MISDKINQLLFSQAVSARPVIVVGMHRSGTTLVTRILEQCGVFMGSQQTGNKESMIFQRLNKEAMDIIGCNWRCIDRLPEIDRMYSHYQWLRKFLHRSLKKGLVAEHFGMKIFHVFRKSIFLWGWKDPRNSLLLPIWHQIFPEAIIVNVIRDGRDVALSLLTREIKREKDKNFFSQEEMTKRYLSNLELWEAYIQRIQQSIGGFEKYCTIRYENLIENPLDEIEKLIQVLDIPVKISLPYVASIVDKTRAGKYAREEFSWTRDLNINTPFLNELGYT